MIQSTHHSVNSRMNFQNMLKLNSVTVLMYATDTSQTLQGKGAAIGG